MNNKIIFFVAFMIFSPMVHGSQTQNKTLQLTTKFRAQELNETITHKATLDFTTENMNKDGTFHDTLKVNCTLQNDPEGIVISLQDIDLKINQLRLLIKTGGVLETTNLQSRAQLPFTYNISAENIAQVVSWYDAQYACKKLVPDNNHKVSHIVNRPTNAAVPQKEQASFVMQYYLFPSIQFLDQGNKKVTIPVNQQIIETIAIAQLANHQYCHFGLLITPPAQQDGIIDLESHAKEDGVHLTRNYHRYLVGIKNILWKLKIRNFTGSTIAIIALLVTAHHFWSK